MRGPMTAMQSRSLASKEMEAPSSVDGKTKAESAGAVDKKQFNKF